MASIHRILVLAAALAIGCIVSPSVVSRKSRLHQESSKYSRALLHLSSANDPKTIQIRSDANFPHSDVTADNPVQSNAEDISSFWWKDIDYDLPWQCGRIKCFFFSTKDPTNGYLVADQRHEHQSKQTYQYAQKLESEYGIRHFFSGPPFETTIPEYFAERMAAAGNDNQNSNDRFDGATSVVVQPSRSAPEYSIIFKCTKVRLYHTLDHVINYGREGYEERLLEELATTFGVVESNPGLVFDFQVMIDLDGRIYHLDLDRVYSWTYHGRALRNKVPKTVSDIKICLENAMDYIRTSMH